MVRTLLFAALLTSGVVNAASFSARLDKPSVALGESVSLTLQAKGLSLDALDITPLTQNFDVFSRTLSRGTDTETLVLTLYPRGSGALRVPSLLLQNLHTTVLNVSVLEGSDSVPQVTAHWSLEPVAPLLNQPVRLTLAICDDGSLQWKRPLIPVSTGRLVREQGEDEGEGRRGDEACTLHRYYWSFIATQDGPASLEVPMLDASRFGQRLRFPGPLLSYQATPLPGWLPTHVPPVAPQVSVAPVPSEWSLNRPLDWRFQVTGGYSAEGLKTLLEMQLRESPALGVYPPLIEAINLDVPGSPLSRFDVTLYFLPRQRGPLALPVLRLPWYDTVHGRLASVELEAKMLTVFDPRWKRFGQIAGGLAGVLMLAGLVWQVRRMIRWRLTRRRGLRRIAEAATPDNLALAIRQFSLSGQPVAPSLGAWSRRLQQEALGFDVNSAIERLEQQQFGRAAWRLAELQQAFLQGLSSVRPKRLA